MKELIKDLSAEQKTHKIGRKTGHYVCEKDKWGYPILPPFVIEARRAADRVQEYKMKITALLNFYHEIRGSEYRHAIPVDPYKRSLYNKSTEEFRGKYGQKDTTHSNEA